MTEDQLREWVWACDRARDAVVHLEIRQLQTEVAIDEARRLLAVAHMLGGVGCERCGGMGERVYGSTSTWRGGIGGQAITPGICDACWGTGRSDRRGTDLRRLERLLRSHPTPDNHRGGPRPWLTGSGSRS